MESEKQSSLFIQNKTEPIPETVRYWRLFVDIVSLVWLGAFITDLFAIDLSFVYINPAVLSYVDKFTIFAIIVFSCDLIQKYYRSDHSPDFFKKHWIDIVIIVPYFRILKTLSIIRIIKMFRFIKIPRVLPVSLNLLRALQRTLKLIKARIYRLLS